MKKQLTMTTAMAAALLAVSGCSQPEEEWNEDVIADRDTEICVDKDAQRVDDMYCHQQPQTAVGGHSGSGGSGFLWYYLGRNSRIPYFGESVRDPRFAAGGSFKPNPDADYRSAPSSSRMSRSQAVSRGGLGASGRRYGGGYS